MDEHELDFGTEFMSDEEVEEMLDNILTDINSEIAAEDSKTAIINPYRVQQVIYTYKLLKYITKKTDAKVTCNLYEPYKSMGMVSVVGSNLLFKNTKWFIKAVEFASNFEVYPKTDGTVQINFTFHGLTMAIE